MKQIFRVLKAIGLAAILLCLTRITVFAQETDETNQFPEGVIEVPEGTAIEIKIVRLRLRQGIHSLFICRICQLDMWQRMLQNRMITVL